MIKQDQYQILKPNIPNIYINLKKTNLLDVSDMETCFNWDRLCMYH